MGCRPTKTSSVIGNVSIMLIGTRKENFYVFFKGAGVSSSVNERVSRSSIGVCTVRRARHDGARGRVDGDGVAKPIIASSTGDTQFCLLAPDTVAPHEHIGRAGTNRDGIAGVLQ